MPYPNTSVFSDDFPVDKYSGAMCPIVPRTWVVICVSFESTSFANPKSPRTGSKSSSRRILAAFRSLCIILGLQCSCRYSSPRAAPKAMRFLVGQSRPLSPGFSSTCNKMNQCRESYLCSDLTYKHDNGVKIWHYCFFLDIPRNVW